MSKKRGRYPAKRGLHTGGDTVRYEDPPDGDGMRVVSSSEYTGLIYSPPGDIEQRRSYNEIAPMPAADVPESK